MMLRAGALSHAICATGLMAVLPAESRAQDADIQKQLANPIASLTLVPIQVNYDAKIGPTQDGSRVTTNIQPVIPIKLNDGMTLVVRTIVPIVSQSNIFPGAESQFGFGDTLQSFFFVPLQSVVLPGELGRLCNIAPAPIPCLRQANGEVGRPAWPFNKRALGRWAFLPTKFGRLRVTLGVKT